MPGGPDEIAMLAGESGHSAVALAFGLTVLLHTKASLGDAGHNPPPRQFVNCACDQ
jgi:hypothetical protein